MRSELYETSRAYKQRHSPPSQEQVKHGVATLAKASSHKGLQLSMKSTPRRRLEGTNTGRNHKRGKRRRDETYNEGYLCIHIVPTSPNGLLSEPRTRISCSLLSNNQCLAATNAQAATSKLSRPPAVSCSSGGRSAGWQSKREATGAGVGVR